MYFQLLYCRTFYSQTLSTVDINSVIKIPEFTISENEETQSSFISKAPPTLARFIGTVLGHNQLFATFTIAKRNIYSHDYLYLEKQYNCECWLHCLFALLGNTLHPMFRLNNWIIAVMGAFTSFPIGTEDILEPISLSEMGSDQDFLFDMNAMLTPLTTNPEFSPGMSVMHVSRNSMEGFINLMKADLHSFGASKILMHSMFSALGNPKECDDERNIYIGAQYVREQDISDIEGLITAFENINSNVIIFCCPMTSKSKSALLHYVIVWLFRETKSIVYYDPNTSKGGVEAPSSSEHVLGYSVPSCLLIQNKADKSIIFIGKKRCAFFFNAKLDSNGVLCDSTRELIASNINERFRILIEDVFKLRGFNIANIVSLDSPNHDESATLQNRRFAVRPSLLRSLNTGNSIGLGLYTKQNLAVVRKDELIGKWTNGKVLVFTEAEREAMKHRNPSWQFYSIQLELSRFKMEAIRREQGLTIDRNENYIAELDCYQAAIDGKCLMSFANSGRNVYHPYGTHVVHNAEFRIKKGSTTPALYATRDIQPNTEILWPYGSNMKLPTT